jgi:hypothetical protein
MTPINRQTARADALHARREELLTVKEFATLARLHVESVRRRIREHRQPGARRVGGQWRIDVVEAMPGGECL